MSKLRIGVIGAGVLGSYHIEKCLKHPELALVGFHDVDPQRRAVVAERFKVETFDKSDSLIDAVDAVIVATPASMHHAVALACLKRGRHVLVEKPLASSRAEGAELVTIAAERECVLHVGHSEVFNPAFTALMSHVPQPKFMEIHRLAAFSPRGTDVSVILDLMVHDLHLVLRLCGGEMPHIDTIAAVGVPVISHDVDIANVRMSFPSGCVVNLTASRISTKRMRKLRIFAHKAYLSADLDTKELVRCSVNEDPKPGSMPVAVVTETAPPADALELELQAFVGSIQSPDAGAAGTTGREALLVLEIAEAIIRKIEDGAGAGPPG